MSTFNFRPFDPNSDSAPADRKTIRRHERVGFSGDSEGASRWYGGFAPQCMHFLESSMGEVLGSTGLLHDDAGGGLWCGGKPLSGTSVTSLVIEPAARGRGVAQEMVKAIVRDAASRKVALCTLYPAVLELYRKAGFELIGDYEVEQIDPAKISPSQKPEGVTMRPGSVADLPAMQALRDQTLTQQRANGAYQRDALSWQMLFQTTNIDPAEVLCFSQDGELCGYLILDMLHGSSGAGGREIWVQDWCARDFNTRCAIVKALASFGTVHKAIHYQDTATARLAEALRPQPTYIKPVMREPLAARVIDPVQALAGRGYRTAISGELRLTFRDEVLDRNHDLALAVADGQGKVGPVKRAGMPKLSMPIGTLGPLLFGYKSANALAELGWLDGAQDALDLADVLFSAERSVTGDFY